MPPTPLSNTQGSTDIFYRIQKPGSGTKHISKEASKIAFLAGACDDNLPTQEFKTEEQKSIVEDHSLWSSFQPRSPLISTTTNEEWALYLATDVISKTESRPLSDIHIAVIRPGLVASGTMKYYHWLDLAQDLGADIVRKSQNDHEYVFLHNIPWQAVVYYGTVEQYKNESQMEALLLGVSSLGLDPDQQAKDEEDEKVQEIESGKDGIDTGKGEDAGVLTDGEKERKAEKKIQAVDEEPDKCIEENSTDDEQNTDNRMEVKAGSDQQEEPDRSEIGTYDPPAE